MHLQRSLEIAGLDADARKSIEEQLLDFKMKCIQEELSERKRQPTEKQRSLQILQKTTE